MEKFGWGREHLNLPHDCSMQEVTKAVLLFQADQGLTQDGKVGPATWRRLEAKRQFDMAEGSGSEGHVLIGGVPVAVNFKSEMCTQDSPYSLIGLGGHSTRTYDPTMVVWHWDAALSGASCYKILKKRKISSHGVIDNDGTFYQFLDLAHHVGWHAGDRGVNKRSIGIDLSNAVYTKYQSYYERRWGSRPVIKAKVHGRSHTLLGYYAAQLETAGRLASFLKEHFGIPLEYPEVTSSIDDPEDFKGHIAHYHITKKKWDVAGFPFKDVLEGKYNV
tara:strand:+ start:40957 stop:41781 length:825 start_codon:yes stop_codon:yes gene_type:complete